MCLGDGLLFGVCLMLKGWAENDGFAVRLDEVESCPYRFPL